MAEVSRLGDGPMPSSRHCPPVELADYFDQVRQILLGFARVGTAHGDLAAYNLLVHHSRVVAIDLPQLVEVISNPGGLELLRRDCVNVCDWFVRRGLACDVEQLRRV